MPSEARERYNEYLNSDYWHRVSESVKIRAGRRCQLCNSPDELHAHHRTYSNRGNEMQHLDDLTCLCSRCHSAFHSLTETIRTPKLATFEHPSGPICVTKKVLKQLRTHRGGFRMETLRILGIAWPPKGKWQKHLIGTQISQDVWQRAYASSKTH